MGDQDIENIDDVVKIRKTIEILFKEIKNPKITHSESEISRQQNFQSSEQLPPKRPQTFSEILLK